MVGVEISGASYINSYINWAQAKLAVISCRTAEARATQSQHSNPPTLRGAKGGKQTGTLSIVCRRAIHQN